MFCPDAEAMGIEQKMAWWHIPVIMTLGRLKEVNFDYREFWASQVYIESESMS